MKGIFSILLLTALVSGCSTTSAGRGFDLIDEGEYRKAIPFLDQSIQQYGDKTAAVALGYLYMGNSQMEPDVEKVRYYHQLTQQMPDGADDQWLRYYYPVMESWLMLSDDDSGNDAQAVKILRASRYSEYPRALVMLGKAYAYGRGTGENLTIARALMDRAVEYDRYQGAAHAYAWLLVTHPDERFRDVGLAYQLMQKVMADSDMSGLSSVHDTMAAVLANSGNFPAAVDAENRALTLLQQQPLAEEQKAIIASWYQCRLQAYRGQQVMRFRYDENPFDAGLSERCRDS